MKYIIGVDGGGTKTEAVVYSVEGDELYKSVTGFGNMVLNSVEAIKNIEKSINNCTIKMKEEEIIGIYLGLAGIEVGENRSILQNHFKDKYKMNINIMNDAELAKSAVLKGEDGVLTIGGTGSICIGTNKGKKITAGGWGHLLGDEGSGYKIVIDSLKIAVQEEDFGTAKGILTEYLLKELNLDHCKQIKDFVYSSTKNQIASLAPTIVKAANDGDINAINILKSNGQQLASLTGAVARRLELSNNIKVGIKGSILTNVHILRKEFENSLNKHFKAVQVIEDEVSCTKGAYYQYIKEAM